MSECRNAQTRALLSIPLFSPRSLALRFGNAMQCPFELSSHEETTLVLALIQVPSPRWFVSVSASLSVSLSLCLSLSLLSLSLPFSGEGRRAIEIPLREGERGREAFLFARRPNIWVPSCFRPLTRWNLVLLWYFIMEIQRFRGTHPAGTIVYDARHKENKKRGRVLSHNIGRMRAVVPHGF